MHGRVGEERKRIRHMCSVPPAGSTVVDAASAAADSSAPVSFSKVRDLCGVFVLCLCVELFCRVDCFFCVLILVGNLEVKIEFFLIALFCFNLFY